MIKESRTESGIIILERNTPEHPEIFKPGNGKIQTYKAGIFIGEAESSAVHFPEAPGQIIIKGDYDERPASIFPTEGHLVTIRSAFWPETFRRKEITFFWGNTFVINMDPRDLEMHRRLGVNTEEYLYLGRDFFLRQWRAKILKHGITAPLRSLQG